MIRGLLFDLDGVLIHSELWHQKLNIRCLKDLGCSDIDPKVFYYTIGSGKGSDPWDRIYEEIPGRYRECGFKETFKAYKAKQFVYPPFSEIVFPDVKNSLAKLKSEGYQLACCSSSRIDYIETALSDCGIADLFDLIISGHDFTRSKPDPEIYLAAMNRLSMNYDECVVIEDSVYGIQAGKNAGMVVVARRDRDFGLDQSQADYLIDSLDEMDDILNKLNR